MQTISINRIIEKVKAREYCLPVFQREYVWTQSDIIMLFDSIMQGFPIGSFLFWEVDRKTFNTCECSFYECIREWSKDKIVGDKLESMNKDKITCILDGQQRISSLYIGLKGGRINQKEKSYLCLNLLHKPESTKDKDDGPKYEFAFITEQKIKRQGTNDGEFWYPLYSFLREGAEDDEVREKINKDLNKALSQLLSKQQEDAKDMAQGLRAKLYNKNLIGYHEESVREADRPMKIFVRTNTGGKKLTPADIFLSILSIVWDEGRDIIRSAREELNEKYKFKFKQQDVLKTCIALSNHERREVGFTKKVNRKTSTMLDIKNKWPHIEESLEKTMKFLKRYGYSAKTLTSNYPIIVIAYYLSYTDRYRSFDDFKLVENQTDRKNIIKWFRKALIQSVFSGPSDTTLAQIRNTIIDHGKEEFPYTKITKEYPIVTGENIDKWMNKAKYGGVHCLSLLSLLSPDDTLFNRIFHQDHIFPQHLFKTALGKFKDRKDSIENIQLLREDKNDDKRGKDPYKWIKDMEEQDGKDEAEHLMRKNHIPNKELLNIDRFEEFLRERGKLMRQKLKEILST